MAFKLSCIVYYFFILQILIVLIVKAFQTDFFNYNEHSSRVLNGETLNTPYNSIEPNSYLDYLRNFTNNSFWQTSIKNIHIKSYSRLNHKSNINLINKNVENNYTEAENRALPSFSILMNFQNDGTTSVQVLINYFI